MDSLLGNMRLAWFQWRAAARGLAANPLWLLDAAQSRRLAQRKGVLARHPVLAWLGAVVALALTWFNIELLLDLGNRAPLTLWAAATYQYTALYLLFFAACAFAICWAAAALFSTLRDALSTLRHAAHGRQELASDNLLRLTQLSPAELLLPTVLRGLRRLWLPHLLLYALAAFVIQQTLAGFGAQGLFETASPDTGWLPGFTHWVMLLGMFCLGGILAACALLLLACGLSRGLPGRLAPAIGAGVWVAAQPALGVLSFYAHATLPGNAWLQFWAVLPLGIVQVSLLAGQLYSSSRQPILRTVMATAFPLVWPILFILLAAFISSIPGLGLMPPQYVSGLSVLSPYSPYLFEQISSLSVTGQVAPQITAQQTLLALLPAQLLLVAAALAFAHSSAVRWLQEDAQ